MRFTRLFIILLALASPLAAETPAEDLEIYQWMDTLEYPITRETPWIAVIRSQPRKPAAEYKTFGFLLRETDAEITLMSAQLVQFNLPKATAKVERADLAAEVRARLANLGELKQNLDFYRQLPDRASLAILARALHQRGEEALAAQALAGARGLRANHRQGSTDESFLTRLKEDFAMTEMWRGICSFAGSETSWVFQDGTPPPSWEDLLQRMERIVRLYPGTKHHPRAQQTAEALRRMIAENKAHRRPTEPGLLTNRERVAELIFQLREQSGRQIMQPGGCDIFSTREDSAAHQLVEIGYEAVPQLIKAVDSQTLTRSVQFHRDFYFSHEVLTAGECVEQILYRLTGRDFQPPSGTPNEQRATALKKVLADWWEPFKNLSEKEILVAEISSGTVHPYHLVERLQKKHPEAVAEAVLAGYQKATGKPEAEYWISHLASLNDPRAGFALSDLMRAKGRPLDIRVKAAQAAHRLGNATAVPLMLAEWEERVGTATEDDVYQSFGGLTRFLAGTGDLRVIQAFGNHLPDLPVRVRYVVIGHIDDWCNPVNAKAHREEARAIEELLATHLEDFKAVPSASMHLENHQVSGPEVRFVALLALSKLAPDRYAFDLTASPGALELAYLNARNAWRAQQGEAALPAPADDRPVLPAESAGLITQIVVLPAEAELSPGFRAALDAQLQKPLRPEILVSLAEGFVRSPSPGFGGLELWAYNEEGGKGITLRAGLLKGSASPKKGWEVWIGDQVGAARAGRMSVELGSTPDFAKIDQKEREALFETWNGKEPLNLRLGILSMDHKW